MTFKHKDGSGSLFVNKHKKEDKHPSMKGTGLYKGEEIEIAAWSKEGENGSYLSLSIQPKKEFAKAAPPPPSSASTLDDEIPF